MKKTAINTAFICIAAVLISGCAKKTSTGEDVIASVNNEKIYAGDVKRALSFKNDPMAKITKEAMNEMLESLIDKKLLIQAAKKERLDEKEKFINTIKSFWEQTLIRDLIDFKQKEISKNIAVLPEQINAYYANLSKKITFKVFKTKNKGIAEKAVKTSPELVKWDQEMGPLSYEDGYSDIILRIFDVPEGQVRIIENEGTFYVVYMAKKESVPVKPLEEIKDDIVDKVKARNIQDAMKKWLHDIKAGSTITINREAMESLKLKN